jgi:hypothetical protein
MKKVLLLAMAVLLVGGLAISKTEIVPITPADLKDLKGTWTGERSGTLGFAKTDLTISNDSLPLQGEVTLWPARERKGPQTHPFKGLIEEGRLKLFWNNKVGSADLGLRKADDGSMELQGTISGRGYSSPIIFKKTT